jgi:hypothetical protein
MQHITAIGFDLFETLVTVDNLRREEAVGRLLHSLKRSGLAIADETFAPITAPPPGGLCRRHSTTARRRTIASG